MTPNLKRERARVFVFSCPLRLEIAVISLLAYGASLITTFLPAWQVAKVYPAEALRYE
ncbi:MAG TPA: hypothetical protein VIH20_05050 [Candidatus Subteraquimicrobiales bacterium]